MAFDVNAALKDGHSEAAIADYLGRQNKFDVATARKDGYSDKDILGFLNKPKPQEGPIRVGEDASDFTRGISNVLPQLESTYGAAKVLAGKKLGSKEMMESGMGSMKAGEAKTQVKESDEFTTALNKGIGTVLTDWLPYQAGAGVGSILETLAAMGIGAGVGAVGGAGVGAIPGALSGILGKTLLKQGIKEAAEKVLKDQGKEAAEKFVESSAKKALISMGSTAGMVGQAGIYGAGETTSRAIGEGQKLAEAEGREYNPEELDLARVMPAAIVHSVAGFFSERIGINALKGLNGKSSESLVLDIAKAIGTTGTKELLPETVQTIAERYGAKLSLTDAEALKEYVNTAAASYAMSIVPGGIGGVRTNLAGRASKEQPTVSETAQGKAVPPAQPETEPAATTATETPTGYVPKFDMTGSPIAQPQIQAQAQVQPPSVEVGGFDNQGNPIVKPQVNADEDLLPDGKALGPNVIDNSPNPNFAPINAIRDYINQKKDAIARGGIKGKILDNTQNKIAKLEQAIPLIGQGKNEEVKKLLPPKYIEEFKLEGILNVKPTNLATIGAGAQTSGEPRADASTAGAAVVDQGGVADTDNVLKGAEVGEGNEPNTLTKVTEPTAEKDNKTKEAQQKAYAEWESTHDAFRAAQNAEVEAYFANEANEQIRFRENQLTGKVDEEPKVQVIPEKVVKRRVSTETKEKQKAMDALAFSIAETKIGIAKGLYTGKALEDAQEQVRVRESQLTNLESGLSLNETVQQNTQRQKDEDAQRLANAPRTQAQVNQRRNDLNKLMADTKAEIEADETLTPQEKQAQIYFNNYMNAAESNTDVALNLLAADLYLGKPFNYNPDAPGTGGEAAKAFRLSLSGANADKLQTKLVNLKNQAMSGGLKNTKKVLALENTEIYGGSTPEFAAAVLRGDLRGALQEIVSDKTGQFTPLDKLISSRLLKDKSLPVINVVEKLDKGYGNYDTGTDVITIREDSLNSHVVLHEALHGFTASLVLGWQSKYIVNGNVTRLNNLYEFLKTNHPEIVNQYAFDDLVEFISEAFSNTNFQAQLSAIPYQKSNVLTEFARRILNLLGISPNKQYTALAEALIVTEEIMTSGRKFQGTAEGVKKVLNLQAEKEPNTRTAYKLEPRTRASYELPEKQKPKNIKYFNDLFFTPVGRENIVKTVQNDRVVGKNVQNEAERAGKIIYGGDNLNNFYDQITLSAGRAKTFYNSYIEEPYNRLNAAVAKLAKEQGVDAEEILMDLHEYFEAKHEPERRMVKYIMTVPLTKDANTEREAIINELKTNIKLTEEQAKEYRQLLDAIVSKNFDANGYSPPGVNLKKPTEAEQVVALQDPNSSYYNVVGLTPQEVQVKIDKFGGMNYLKEITSAMKDLHEATIEMNKKSNYWSKPVNNLKNFYGFENYVPLKGLNLTSETDENLDFTSERLSGELVKSEESFEGRVSVSNNPVLQTLADSVQAAMRAGRGVETTLSIKNAIKDGIIQGSVNKQKGQGGKPISFAERTTSDILKQLKENKGNKLILHYNDNGSIDILQIDSSRVLESIRRTYSKQNSLVDVANSITSTLGKMHTRYNYNFAPLNFVRDALTNAFNIGAKIGPFKSAEFLGKLAVDLATNGAMNKAFKVARLYSQPNGLEKIKDLATKTGDPIYINMAEYIKQGGMVEYLQGMSIKSNFDELNKKVGRSGIITKVEDFNKMIDIWNNMFEIASRSSAFGIMQSHYMNTQKLTKEDANTRAAAFVKNLANFEQIGTHGKALGAIYMFARPSATGAARAIEAIAPIFADVDRARNRLPNNGLFAFEMVGGERVYKNPAAVAEWEKNYAFERKSAGYMAASLLGLGAMMYTMSLMMAPDDELGRNKTNTDNMDQWNRFVRFHFPFTDKVFQIPWGFGLGAFAAAGAQLAAAMSGNGTLGDAMRNIFTQISLDSFVPIPVSRMKFSDNPAMWAVDSVLPSFMRPVVEFTVNINGIGQNIYNDSNRRMGDAYLGGDNIPQVYKDIAEYLTEKTLGYIDWSPNSIYFLTNSYMDGPSRALLELPTSIYDTASGRKEFTPKSVPLIGSFISSESSIDAREFAEYEKDIKDTRRILEGFDKRSPESAIKYNLRNPMAELLVETYEDGNKDLNKLRAEANDIRNLPISPAEITELLKMNKLEQNLLKNELVGAFKAYDNLGKD